MKFNKNLAKFDGPFGYRWLMFCVLAIIYFFTCLHRISPTVIARDLVLEFHANATTLGIMSSAYFYLYSAVQPPVGILSNTWGSRLVTTVFMLVACLGAVIFGFAPDMTVATVGRALIGIGVGGVFVPGLKVFSEWYAKREFAGVTGLFLAAGNAGNLAASLPLTYLVLLLGWRMSYVAMGVVSFLMAALCWVILRDRPEDKGWAPIEVSLNPSSPVSQTPPADITTAKRLRIVFRNPGFWMVTVSTFFFGGAGAHISGSEGGALPDGCPRLQPASGRRAAYASPPRIRHRRARLWLSCR